MWSRTSTTFSSCDESQITDTAGRGRRKCRCSSNRACLGSVTYNSLRLETLHVITLRFKKGVIALGKIRVKISGLQGLDQQANLKIPVTGFRVGRKMAIFLLK